MRCRNVSSRANHYVVSLSTYTDCPGSRGGRMPTDSTIKVLLTGAQIVRLLCNTVANARTRMCGPVRERSKIAKRAGGG